MFQYNKIYGESVLSYPFFYRRDRTYMSFKFFINLRKVNKREERKKARIDTKRKKAKRKKAKRKKAKAKEKRRN